MQQGHLEQQAPKLRYIETDFKDTMFRY